MDEAHRAYYEARAREYDDWWLGRGLFAARDRPGWPEEVGALEQLLAALPPARTLDVACGTGFMTRNLRGLVVGLDQSPTSCALAQRRLPDGVAVVGDALDLPFPDRAFERVVAGHFYGHLLGDDRTRFLEEARRVGDELVIVDAAGEPREEWQERKLKDGSAHSVYKRWFTGHALAAELGGGEVLHDGRWFVVVRS
jgi:demethylmenaquinone methyltransferase/2-methoxy-6-polyprenyl-1,4-benzoquinol methylase